MRRMLPLTALAAGTLLLAGCSILPFGNDTPATGGSDGSGGSSGMGQSGQNGPTAPPSDEGTGDDSAIVMGPGRLPASWPAEIYVPDGEVVNAIEAPGSWVAEISVNDEVAAVAEVSAALQDAGFTVIAETSSGSGSIGVYENARYQVQVLGTNTGGGPSLTYSIVEK